MLCETALGPLLTQPWADSMRAHILRICPLRSLQLISTVAAPGVKGMSVNFLAEGFYLPRQELEQQRAVKGTAESCHL